MTILEAIQIKGAIREDGRPCYCDWCVPIKESYSPEYVHHWDGSGWWFIGDFEEALKASSK